jgi:WXG100 family type VII secretion target
MDWNVNGDIMKVLDMLGLPMPGGNGGVLRSIAQDWNTMAAAVEGQVDALNQAVAAVGPDEWSGSAADSFHQHWQTQSAEVAKGLANFKQVAASLDSYADTVDSINEEILSIAEQILAASVAGALLTVVTAGISDAVAAAADAAEAARIAALIARFTELAEQVGVDIDRMVEVVGEVLSKIKSMLEALKTMLETVDSTKYGKMALTVGKDLASNFVADSGANISSQYLSGQKVTLGADLENGALDAAGTVATAGVLGRAAPKLGSMATAGLANVGGGIFQSEAGGLTGVSGDTEFQNPFTGAGLSADVQNLEGAAADGLGGAYAHDGSTAKNGQVFSISDTIGSLTTTTETSGTALKQTLSSLEGQDGAMPVSP